MCFVVMPGLVPGIHVLLRHYRLRKSWMAGTSPAMTELTVLPSRQLRTFPERHQFRVRDLAPHRGHPAIGARHDLLLGDVLHRFADHLDDLLGGLAFVARH